MANVLLRTGLLLSLWPHILGSNEHKALQDMPLSIEHITLVDGSTPFEGRVEICVDDEQKSYCGTVCNMFWNQASADYVCRNLGFDGRDRNKELIDSKLGNGNGGVFGMECTTVGTNTTATQCHAFNVTNLPECAQSDDVHAGVHCMPPTVEPCGREWSLNDSQTSGWILSPGFPNDYPSSSDCEWMVMTKSGNVFNVTLRMFYLADDDWLFVRDDKLIFFYLVGKKHEYTVTKDSFERGVQDHHIGITKENILRIHFVSYILDNYRGFAIFYTAFSLTRCDDNECSNKGECHQEHDMKVCECNDGWTGQKCSQEVIVCNSMPCMNGGTCEASISKNITYYCVCPEEYTGKHCQDNAYEMNSTLQSSVFTSGYPSFTMYTDSIASRDSGNMNYHDDDDDDGDDGDDDDDDDDDDAGGGGSSNGDDDGKSAESSKGTSTGGIVGGVVAGTLLIIAIAVVVCFVIYKRRKRNETTDNQTKGNECMHHHNVTYEDKLTFTDVTMTTNDITDGATQLKESDVYYSSIGDPHKKSDYTVADDTKQGNGGHHPVHPEIQQHVDDKFTEDGFVDNIAYEAADDAQDVAEPAADGGKGSNEAEGFVENVAYEGLQSDCNSYETI